MYEYNVQYFTVPFFTKDTHASLYTPSYFTDYGLSDSFGGIFLKIF